MRVLALNEPEDLVTWAQSASKAEMAALAVEVFRAWEAGDALAAEIVAGVARTLADYATACAQHVTRAAQWSGPAMNLGKARRPGAPVRFILAGSVLLKAPRFAQRVKREIRRLWPAAVVTPLERESAWGAVELARRLGGPAVPEVRGQRPEVRREGQASDFGLRTSDFEFRISASWLVGQPARRVALRRTAPAGA